MGYRDEYLDECMVLEGQGKSVKGCAGCNKLFPAYRCRDCKIGPLWCKGCIVLRHDQSPLHRIEARILHFIVTHPRRSDVRLV